MARRLHQEELAAQQQQQQQQQQQEHLTIVLPDDAEPGQTLTVQGPHGEPALLTVPEGAVPGQQIAFMVQTAPWPAVFSAVGQLVPSGSHRRTGRGVEEEQEQEAEGEEEGWGLRRRSSGGDQERSGEVSAPRAFVAALLALLLVGQLVLFLELMPALGGAVRALAALSFAGGGATAVQLPVSVAFECLHGCARMRAARRHAMAGAAVGVGAGTTSADDSDERERDAAWATSVWAARWAWWAQCAFAATQLALLAACPAACSGCGSGGSGGSAPAGPPGRTEAHNVAQAFVAATLATVLGQLFLARRDACAAADGARRGSGGGGGSVRAAAAAAVRAPRAAMAARARSRQGYATVGGAASEQGTAPQQELALRHTPQIRSSSSSSSSSSSRSSSSSSSSSRESEAAVAVDAALGLGLGREVGSSDEEEVDFDDI
jgi:hypothetical protein